MLEFFVVGEVGQAQVRADKGLGPRTFGTVPLKRNGHFRAPAPLKRKKSPASTDADGAAVVVTGGYCPDGGVPLPKKRCV